MSRDKFVTLTRDLRVPQGANSIKKVDFASVTIPLGSL